MCTLAFVEKSRGEYWDRLNAGARHAALRRGIDVRIDAPTVIDVPNQRRMVASALDSGVDALVLVASDPLAFAPEIDRALDSGVPVLTMDLDGYLDRRLFYVGTLPFAELGRMAAEELLARLEHDGPVIAQAGSNAPGAAGKLQGFLDRMAESGTPTVVIEADFEHPDLAYERVLSALSATPDVAGLYGVYAYHPTVQARAVEAAGRRPGSLPIVGFDMTDETTVRISDGSIAASIWIAEYKIGAAATAAAELFCSLPWDEALDVLGGSLDDRRGNVRRLPVTCFSKENIADYSRWLAEHD